MTLEDRMRSFMFILLLAALLAASPGSRAGESEDDRFAAFFKAYLERQFKEQPLVASRLGDHRFDDRLDDVSPKARAGWVKRDRDTLSDLARKIDVKKLSAEARIDFQIFQH